MSGIYYSDIDGVLRAAGLTVSENQHNAGWQTRARSSGGFPEVPLGVVWHHTASNTTPANDLSWQCSGCDDNPVGNMLIDRDGICWIVAAGASNCAGKGGPVTLSRGTVPLDSGNTRCWNIEVANNGVGERWPVAQINSYFVASNALNAHFGNRPDDVISHALGEGNGWTDRKIDPSTTNVEGPWQPSSVNSSGTWSLTDIRNECLARAGSSPAPGPGPGPGPIPPPSGDDDMVTVIKGDGADSYWAWNGVSIAGIPSLEWVQWGYEAGLYRNTDPVMYPQGYVDQLVDAQGER